MFKVLHNITPYPLSQSTPKAYYTKVLLLKDFEALEMTTHRKKVVYEGFLNNQLDYQKTRLVVKCLLDY